MLDELNKAGTAISTLAEKLDALIVTLPIAGARSDVADLDALINRLCDAVDPAEIKAIIAEAKQFFITANQVAENLMEVTEKLKAIADKFN